jgi:hypothetical protein
MKRRLLGLLAAAALAATGFTTYQTGWVTARAAGAPVARERPADPLATDSGRRFCRNQPLHWRDVALPR